MNILKLKQMLQQCLMEDIGQCDVTSDTIFDQGEQGTLTFIAKEGGVFSGGDVIKTGFALLDEQIEVFLFVQDGEVFESFRRECVANASCQQIPTGVNEEHRFPFEVTKSRIRAGLASPCRVFDHCNLTNDTASKSNYKI